MPIHNYCGLPGSGKSYSVVEQVIIPSLHNGRRIVTNLPLRMEVLYEDFPSADVELVDLVQADNDLFDLDAHPVNRGAVFVLDEIWKRWPQGTRVEQIPSAVGAFFAEHRHFVGDDGYTTEIVIVCQSLNQIAAFIRDLVDTTYISKKLDKAGQASRFRVDIYSGPQVLNRENHEMLIRQAFSSYDANVYRYYRSHTRNASGFGHGKEKPIGRSSSMWRSPVFMFGVPVGLLAGYVAVTNLAAFFDTSELHQDAEVATARSDLEPARSFGSVSPVVLPSPVRPPAYPVSEQWRLAAIVWGSARDGRDGLAVLHAEKLGRERIIRILGHCSSVAGVPYEWECVVDGELVTQWSGSSSSGGLL